MRKAREKVEGEGFYHVYNRMSGKRMLLRDPALKGMLLEGVRRAGVFSGVEVLTYAIMDNHFHLLVRVPEKREITDEELAGRVRALYGERRAARMLSDWEAWESDASTAWCAVEARRRLAARMNDLSQFVKTFAERFTMEYNRRTGNTGSPWGRRFGSVLVERGESLAPVAAYIDLNPVRAGIAAEPGQCAWTGYGAALRGDPWAREGLASLHARAFGSDAGDWSDVESRYRKILDGRLAADAPDSGPAPRFDAAEVRRKLSAGESLTLFELLRCRVRQFCAGVAFGGAAFTHAVRESRKMRGAPHRLPCVGLSWIGTAAGVRRRDAVALP